jgi:hypothetical protein
MSLSIRDVDGNLLNLSDHLFSGAVPIGSGTYSGVIRLYNNYDAEDDIAHVRNVKLFFSAVSGSTQIPIDYGDPLRDVRSNGMFNDKFSGVCTYSSQLDADPSDVLVNINNGIQGRDFDIIYASGSNNFNEYRVEILHQSGTILDVASGTIFAHVEYRTYKP